MKPRYRTGDQAWVREINLSTLLRYIHESAPLSRARLAHLTGLNKTTVSSLSGELIERGLIHEVGLETSGGGRPATLLEPNPQAGHVIGVEFGVDSIAAILADFAGQTIWRRVQGADPAEGQDVVIGQALQLVDEATAVSRSHETRLLGLGLAAPGTVDVDNGRLVFSPPLQWSDVPFRQIFHRHTGLLTMVDNNANAGALGEHLFGVARRAQDFVFVFAGVGIGGGLFLKGELYRGAGGFAGEIGHTDFLAGPYRSPCRCGKRGCWETSANQYALVERVRARLAVGRSSLVSRLMAEPDTPLTVSLIVQAADAGDREALEALSETGSLLGLGVANLVSIFNPEMVVIGGPLSIAGKHLLPAIQDGVQRTALRETQEQTEIVLSAFGPDASLIGAVALVIEAILSTPSRVGRFVQAEASR